MAVNPSLESCGGIWSHDYDDDDDDDEYGDLDDGNYHYLIVGAFEELEEALSACQIVTVHCAVGRDHHSTENNTIPDGG